MDLQFFNFSWTPLSITGILFLRLGLGRTEVPKGGSAEPGFGLVVDGDLSEYLNLLEYWMTWWDVKYNLKQNMSCEVREIIYLK